MSQTYEDKLTLEAFNGKLGRAELLHSETLEKGVYLYTADLSYIDWNAWEYVLVVMMGKPGGASNDFACSAKRANGGEITSYCGGGTGLIRGYPGPFALLFLPRHNAENPIRCLSIGNGGGAAWSDSAFSQITSLYCTSNSAYPMVSGTVLTVWGVR